MDLKNCLSSNNINVSVRKKVYNKKYFTLDGSSKLSISILNFTNESNGVFHAYVDIDTNKFSNFGVSTSISEQLS